MTTLKINKEVPLTPDGYSRWIQPKMNKYFMACCDCGLVHEAQFRIVGIIRQRVQFRVRRSSEFTGKMRRGKKCNCFKAVKE